MFGASWLDGIGGSYGANDWFQNFLWFWCWALSFVATITLVVAYIYRARNKTPAGLIVGMGAAILFLPFVVMLTPQTGGVANTRWYQSFVYGDAVKRQTGGIITGDQVLNIADSLAQYHSKYGRYPMNDQDAQEAGLLVSDRSADVLLCVDKGDAYSIEIARQAGSHTGGYIIYNSHNQFDVKVGLVDSSSCYSDGDGNDEIGRLVCRDAPEDSAFCNPKLRYSVYLRV